MDLVENYENKHFPIELPDPVKTIPNSKRLVF